MARTRTRKPSHCEIEDEIKSASRAKGLLVLGCFDPIYVHKCRHPTRNTMGVDKFGAGSNAGYVHMLAKPRQTKNVPFKVIKALYASARMIAYHSIMLAVTLRGVTRILVTTHPACAHLLYEGCQFENNKEEQERHQRDRNEAAKWIKREFPQLEVWSCFYYLDKKGHVQIKHLKKY